MPAEIIEQAVKCSAHSTIWQLQQYLRDETAPPSEWSKGLDLFKEQLFILAGVEDLQLRGQAIRALADLYLVFRPSTFAVCH